LVSAPPSTDVIWFQPSRLVRSNMIQPHPPSASRNQRFWFTPNYVHSHYWSS